MLTLKGFSELPRKLPAVVAIGVFDGVHLGHRRIIDHAVSRARNLGVTSFVLTFEPHPAELFGQNGGSRLMSPPLKERFIAEAGPDFLLVVNFDLPFSQLTPDEFIGLLCESFILRGVVVGANFHYGVGASGAPGDLVVTGDESGFEVDLVPLLEVGGTVVSSTAVRKLLQGGAVEQAGWLLGRPPVLTGTVVPGKGRGESLGIHTANLDSPYRGSTPGSGVYAGLARAGEKVYPAAVSVGTQPTFPDPSPQEVCEVHLIGYEGDLYGAELEVELHARLREQRRFQTRDDLAQAIREDIRRTLALVGTGRESRAGRA